MNVTSFRFSPSLVQEGIAWLNYSLDGKPEAAANITSLGPGTPEGHSEMANGILSDMSDGTHTVYIHGNTTFDKYPAIPETSFSLTIYFKIDTVHPTLKVLSPQPSATYTSPNITLNFTVNEQIAWAGYSVDGGPIITDRINTTITGLSYRTHVIRIYANDSAGNECFSPTIAFTVKDVEPPVISILSKVARYNMSSVPLEFTVDENASWLSYSLDGQTKVTIEGNITLTGLSSGFHSLKVYANDTSGNVGVSESFDFTISDNDTSPLPSLFPMFLLVSATVATVITLVALVYLKKRKADILQKVFLLENGVFSEES